MMKKIIVFMSSLFMLSCVQGSYDAHIISSIIRDLECNPMGQDSYLIVKSRDVPVWYERTQKAYWVGPFYEELTQPLYGFFFPKENIFRIDGCENLYIYDKRLENNNGISNCCYVIRDSVPIVNSNDANDTMFIDKTPFVNYTKRARMYKKYRGCVSVNYQPDTLVIPKISRDSLIEY